MIRYLLEERPCTKKIFIRTLKKNKYQNLFKVMPILYLNLNFQNNFNTNYHMLYENCSVLNVHSDGFMKCIYNRIVLDIVVNDK